MTAKLTKGGQFLNAVEGGIFTLPITTQHI